MALLARPPRNPLRAESASTNAEMTNILVTLRSCDQLFESLDATVTVAASTGSCVYKKAKLAPGQMEMGTVNIANTASSNALRSHGRTMEASLGNCLQFEKSTAIAIPIASFASGSEPNPGIRSPTRPMATKTKAEYAMTSARGLRGAWFRSPLSVAGEPGSTWPAASKLNPRGFSRTLARKRADTFLNPAEVDCLANDKAECAKVKSNKISYLHYFALQHRPG